MNDRERFDRTCINSITLALREVLRPGAERDATPMLPVIGDLGSLRAQAQENRRAPIDRDPTRR